MIYLHEMGRILAALLLVASTALAADRTIAFVGADVIALTGPASVSNDGRGRRDAGRGTPEILRNHTVVVKGDRIIAITPGAKPPRGATVINARGKYLLPGLGEMHGHIPPPTAPREVTESVLFLYLANGITTVRGMLGAPGQLELRERARRGEILSPNLYLAGPSFSGPSINSPEEAIAKVRQQKAEGWDLLKVHPGLTRDEYDAMARTAREVGMRFGGHVPVEVGLLHAIEMGQETFDHIDGFVEYLEGDKGPVDDARLSDVVRRTRQAEAWVVPTMALWETLVGTADLERLKAYPEIKYVPRQQVQQWITAFENRLKNPPFNARTARTIIDNRMKILSALNRGGVRILMGTDAPQQFSVPGFSIRHELVRMSAAGMTPYEILVSGTRNVGEYFKSQDKFGTIEVGSRADLLLVEADPLKDILNVSKIAGIMVRGRWLPRTEINSRLAEIEATFRAN